MFESSYVVELDCCSTSELSRGGTFLQMCGSCINPRDEFYFLVSAMGNMDYNNFGMRCYHFSFNCSGSGLCNFRKTSRTFYVLSQVPEPVPERGRWYKLHFARNGSRFLFFVDGRVSLEYFDMGN